MISLSIGYLGINHLSLVLLALTHSRTGQEHLKSISSNNYEMNSNYKRIGSNDNTGIMDYLNNINNNNTYSYINYMSPIYLKNNQFYNNINKSIRYEDIALNKNNIMNIPFNYGNNKNNI